MDVANQRTDALKKAFADVILNVTKETAARVLASEKKAARFQQELAACKDDALQTLLRVKCIMDTRINEKERISLDQARRIQELETQLEEAKQTIKSLETNLERVKKEMVILKDKPVQTMKKEDCPSECTKFEGLVDEGKITQISKTLLCSPSYACESFSNKKCAYLCHQSVTRKPCSVNSSKTELDNVEAVKSNSSNAIVLTNGNCLKGEVKLQRLSTGRRAKRKARLLTSLKGHVKFDTCKIPPDPDSASQKIQEFACLASLEGSVVGCENGLQLPLREKPLAPVVDTDGHGTMSIENEELKDVSARPSVTIIQDGYLDAIPSGENFSNSNDHSSSEGKPTPPNSKSNGLDSACDVDKQELPLVNFDDKRRDECKSVEVGTSHGPGDRFLKYTFRRKRIRGSSNDVTAETTDAEKSNPLKKKPSLNEDFDLEPPRSSMAGRQSSSDSRRVAQVARQLISLSQKRWG